VSDHVRKKQCDRLVPMPQDEFLELAKSAIASDPVNAEIVHDLEYALGLLNATKPECYNYLWTHFILGLDYDDIAEEQNLNNATVRMRIRRCLEKAQSLVSCACQTT
jgi:DNA-directed RNA polymerase specialized sigma24 family protein